MPGNPLGLNFSVWGYLAPLPWVKMLWKSLHHFDVHLHMAYPIIAIPRERDQVLMETFFSEGLDAATICSLGKCRVALEVLFLLDITTADGRYLEEFVFTPGGRERERLGSNFHVSIRPTPTGVCGLTFGTASQPQEAN